MRTFTRAASRETLLILLAAGGFFLAFPNPFIQLPPAALLMPASILLLSLEAHSGSRALFCSFLCMFLGSSSALYWLAIPMHNFAGVPWLAGASCVMLLGGYYGLYGLLFSLFLRFFTRRLALYPALAACAASWGALELIRGNFLTGFPWLSLSSAFAGWPALAQGAALFGMYGLSALYTLLALLLALPCLSPPAGSMACSLLAPGTGKSPKPLLPALILIACVAAYGTQRLGISWNKLGENFLAAMVQGNINQTQKWTPENRARIIRLYLDLSAQALELAEKQYGREADLLLWPETAMPFTYELSQGLSAPLRNFTAEKTIPLLFGAIGAEPDGSTYNRILLLDRRGERAGHYDKEHLVPFGEYVPPGLYVPFASEFLQGTGFSPGKNERALWLPSKKLPGSSPRRVGASGWPAGDIALGPLICYEVIFPELAQQRVERNAAILVSVSNDAWFERSPAPLQHLQLAAMRCIEQGRYMLRSTNTGISAALDPAGRILNPGPLFEPWVQIEAVRALDEKTFYHAAYAWINGALLLLPFMLFIKALLIPIPGKNLLISKTTKHKE